MHTYAYVCVCVKSELLFTFFFFNQYFLEAKTNLTAAEEIILVKKV